MRRRTLSGPADEHRRRDLAAARHHQLPGDTTADGIQVISDFNGRDKHRAVYQFDLPTPAMPAGGRTGDPGE